MAKSRLVVALDAIGALGDALPLVSQEERLLRVRQRSAGPSCRKTATSRTRTKLGRAARRSNWVHIPPAPGALIPRQSGVTNAVLDPHPRTGTGCRFTICGNRVSSSSVRAAKGTGSERRQSRQVTSTPSTPMALRSAIVGGGEPFLIAIVHARSETFIGQKLGTNEGFVRYFQFK